ncbi:TlpA family protein disulfide reductase [Mycolicibacterium vinylchloridicum]|uniref:TlpA family protein disulfide reductase n=1 Tax=Mycolicibacterium vinylchloridicum TaxID=2736928 RepID=UPI0015CDE0D3|nr:TlpA disulfide reductase family protein [Mycolicibacterium vinylchloridicum]
MTTLVAAAAVTVASVLISHDTVFTPPAQETTASNAGEGAEPADSETGAIPCPAPVRDGSAVPVLSRAIARCLGSAQPMNVGAAVAGAPTLLNLWASWCAPCREEMPVLYAYSKTSGALRVIGVNVRDRPSSATALLRDLDIGYASFTDADAVARALQAPQLLPLSYLVDTDGSVRRLPMKAFRDVAQVTEAVAAARGERQKQ